MAADSVLTSAERRRVRWYYVLPSLGRRCFATIFVVMGEFLLLAMMNDLVFHDRGAFPLGWAVMIAIVVVLTAVVCWSIIAHNYLGRNKKWDAIKEKARAHAANQGKPWGTRKGEKDGDVLEFSAKRVATAAGVKLPSRRAACRTATALALGLLTVVYAVHFVGLSLGNRGQQETAAQTVSSVEDGLEGAGLYVYGADPLEGFDPDGYAVSGEIEGDDAFASTSSVRLVVDNAGEVSEVSYTLLVDPELPLAESLAQAEADLAALHDAVAVLDVPASAPGLLGYGELPEEFCSAYLAGSPDEDVFVHEDELDVVDGAQISCSYLVTIDEGEYLDSTIWLTLEPAE